MIERWDGTSWSVIPSPNPGNISNYLYGVATVSLTDVWAVGAASKYNNNSYYNGPLTEHWDGTSWSVIPNPNLGNNDYQLSGVAAISSRDVWAVGYSNFNGLPSNTLTEHWDGTSWSVIPSPNPGNNGKLYGVAAVSSDDVWTVGYYYDSNGGIPERLLNTGTAQVGA